MNILITGASSGLGEALALAYARPGARLFLSGRNPERLEAAAAACRAKGAEAESRVADVADAACMTAWIAEVEVRAPLDLLIANAGVSAGDPAMAALTEEERSRAVFSINLGGVLNSVLPVIEPMKARGKGQIALMSSLAGLRGFPSAPAYCAAKAAVRVWGEGLRGRLAPFGVGVSVICPGFVKSRITARNRFPMPFLMEADAAAGLIVKGLAADRGLIRFPWPLVWIMVAVVHLPRWLLAGVSRALPVKE